jgi:hypothetical protein
MFAGLKPGGYTAALQSSLLAGSLPAVISASGREPDRRSSS